MKSHEFFSQNRDRINKVIERLSDRESKITYQKQIAFRSKGKKAGFIKYHGGEDFQYFANDFFRYSDCEVLIDCGAFTGDTIERFIELHPKYELIVGFEPDIKNYAKLYKKYEKEPKIKTI